MVRIKENAATFIKSPTTEVTENLKSRAGCQKPAPSILACSTSRRNVHRLFRTKLFVTATKKEAILAKDSKEEKRGKIETNTKNTAQSMAVLANPTTENFSNFAQESRIQTFNPNSLSTSWRGWGGVASLAPWPRSGGCARG
jgi:hypothetical protein